jgi:hypothetical protein
MFVTTVQNYEPDDQANLLNAEWTKDDGQSVELKARKQNDTFCATFTERLSIYWCYRIQRKCIELPSENPYQGFGKYCHLFRGVTADGVCVGDLDFLTTGTHHSELQVITALSLISTLYKSPQHPLSLFSSLLCL